jgi:hypothetical protein
MNNNTIKPNQYLADTDCPICSGRKRFETNDKCVTCHNAKNDTGDSKAVARRLRIEAHQELIAERINFTGV